MHEVDVKRLMFCYRQLEGILVIIGSLADANDRPELGIVHNVLMETTTQIRNALRANDENMEQL